MLALELIAGLDAATPTAPLPAAKTIVQVVREVARQIGNTQSVCRRFYIHPAVLDTVLAQPGQSGGTPPSGSTESELLRLLSRGKPRAR